MKNISLSLLLLVSAFSVASIAAPIDKLDKSCNELLQPINESAGSGEPIKMHLNAEAFSKSFDASTNAGFESYWNDRHKASALYSFFKNWHQWRLNKLRKKTMSQQPTYQMEVAKDAVELAKTGVQPELLEKLDGTIDQYKSVSNRIKLLYLQAYVHYASYRLLKKAYDYHLPTESMPLSIQNFPIIEVDKNGEGKLAFKDTESYQNRYAIKSDLELHKKKWKTLVGYVFKRGQVGVLEVEQARLRADLKTYRWALYDAKLENRFVQDLEDHWQEINSLLNDPELRASSVAALVLARKMRKVESSRLKEIKKGKDTVYEDWVDQLAAASEGVVDRSDIEKGLEDMGFDKVKTAWEKQYTKFKDGVKTQLGNMMSSIIRGTIYATLAVSAASQWDELVSHMESATDGLIDKGMYVANLATGYSLAIDRIAKSDKFDLEKSIFIDTYFSDIKDALLADNRNSEVLNSVRAQELREVLLEIEWRRFEYQSAQKEKLLSDREKQVQQEVYEKMLQDLVSEVNYFNLRMMFLAIEDKRGDAQAHTFLDYLKSVSDADIDLYRAEKLMSWYQNGILEHSHPPRTGDLNLDLLLNHMLNIRKSYDRLLAKNPKMTTTQALSMLLQDDGFKPFTFGETP